VREELLKICESVKPDIVLIGSTSSKSKIRNVLSNRTTLNYIKDNVKNISVLSDSDNEELIKNKNNKAREPKVSKQSKLFWILLVKNYIQTLIFLFFSFFFLRNLSHSSESDETSETKIP
jgi:hypothetical protein